MCSDVEIRNRGIQLGGVGSYVSFYLSFFFFLPSPDGTSFSRVRCSISAANVIFPVRCAGARKFKCHVRICVRTRVYLYVNKQTNFVSTYDASRGRARLPQLSRKITA